DDKTGRSPPPPASHNVSGPEPPGSLRGIVNPCSSPSGPFTYHSFTTPRSNHTRFPPYDGATCANGCSLPPYPIAASPTDSLNEPDRTSTPHQAQPRQPRPRRSTPAKRPANPLRHPAGQSTLRSP